jgi:hypothetical protein
MVTDRPESIYSNLFALAMRAGDEDIRARAINLLADAKVPPLLYQIPRESLISQLLSDAGDQPQLAKIEYIARVGEKFDLPALDRFAAKASQTVRVKADEARTRILTREDPERMIVELLCQRQVFSPDVKRELEYSAVRIPDQILANVACSCPDPALRLFAVQ